MTDTEDSVLPQHRYELDPLDNTSSSELLHLNSGDVVDELHHVGGAISHDSHVIHHHQHHHQQQQQQPQQQQPQLVHMTNNLDLMDFARTRRSRASFVDPGGPPLVFSLTSSTSTTNEMEQERESLLASISETTPIVEKTQQDQEQEQQQQQQQQPPTYGQYGALLQALDAIEKKQEPELLQDEPEDTLEEQRETNVIKQRRGGRQLQRGHPCPAQVPVKRLRQGVIEIFHQIPAIVATLLLILMVAVPFGVSYFPIQWSNDWHDNDTTTGGPFPLPGRESLGIRMALLATATGQLVMTFASGFDNPIAFQLLENVPFYQALAHIVFAEQGYGADALSTLFFLFGLSSVLVGLTFFTLGKLKLGRVAYFFPGHVLVGCIGGIGVFIALSSIEVTNNQDLSFNQAGWDEFVSKFHLFGLVLALELVLRVLSAVLVDSTTGQPKFRFLAPVYFCSIVPLFYVGLYLCGSTIDQARDWGYLFPDPTCAADDGGGECPALSFHEKVDNGHLWDIFRIIDFRLISWTAVYKSLGTVVALCAFSLIHVPINIPAFAVSSNVDVDMNRELMAHGYSNMLSGLFGGLQNVMTYSFSVLYQKSGGGGIPSCLAVTAGIALLFVYGPAMAVYFPRCMAGTLLLHIGLDLFLEGCYDSFHNFDSLEYAGIWLITIVMTTMGMTAALLAGIISAMSTYAVQSMTYPDPIFRIMRATTLRSSAWGRPSEAMEILDHALMGRARILIVQLQGHLFFGNIADVTDTIKELLSHSIGTNEHPFIVVMDFSLVVGMDSSAAHAIAKFKGIMHRLYQLEVSIFVTGTHRDGFPCDYALSEALSAVEPQQQQQQHVVKDFNDVAAMTSPKPSKSRRGSVAVSETSESFMAVRTLRDFPKNRVCNSLDKALVFAEDILVARVNPAHLETTVANSHLIGSRGMDEGIELTEQEERRLAESFMENIVPMTVTPEIKRSIQIFVSKCVREEYKEGDILWREGDESHSAMILVSGCVRATLEGTKVLETVERGQVFGELGLIDGVRRLSTVTCISKRLVVYSLKRERFDLMVEYNRPEARLLERIAIRYLAHRVQHVSNRIFDTHCLPI